MELLIGTSRTHARLRHDTKRNNSPLGGLALQAPMRRKPCCEPYREVREPYREWGFELGGWEPL